MLNAVWVAVIVAVAAWVALAGVAVYLMIRFSRLVTQTSEAVSGLRERGDLLIDRGNAALDRADEQLARTGAITSTMDEVTENMAALTGRVAALAPLARMIAGSARSPVGRMVALGYGVNHAVSRRLDRRPRVSPRQVPLSPEPLAREPLTGRQRAALTGRRSGGPSEREETQP